jgi:hypothetical protein
MSSPKKKYKICSKINKGLGIQMKTRIKKKIEVKKKFTTRKTRITAIIIKGKVKIENEDRKSM